MSGKGGYEEATCSFCGKVMNGGKLPEHLAKHLKGEIDE